MFSSSEKPFTVSWLSLVPARYGCNTADVTLSHNPPFYPSGFFYPFKTSCPWSAIALACGITVAFRFLVAFIFVLYYFLFILHRQQYSLPDSCKIGLFTKFPLSGFIFFQSKAQNESWASSPILFLLLSLYSNSMSFLVLLGCAGNCTRRCCV